MVSDPGLALSVACLGVWGELCPGLWARMGESVRERRKRRSRTIEERRERRDLRKELYGAYLNSAEWLAVRERVMARDGHLCKVPGCGKAATQVHHERYPKNIGEENLDWLHSLCGNHHLAIHLLMESGIRLRDATRYYLLPTAVDETPRVRLVKLPDDWRLSKRASRQRALEGSAMSKQWAKNKKKARKRLSS